VLNVQSAGDSRYDAGRAAALSAVPKTTGYWWPRDAGTDLPASPHAEGADSDRRGD